MSKCECRCEIIRCDHCKGRDALWSDMVALYRRVSNCPCPNCSKFAQRIGARMTAIGEALKKNRWSL